jgi:hypothetical protein
VASRRPGVNSNRINPGRLVDEASGNAVVNGVPVKISKVSDSTVSDSKVFDSL